MSGLTLRMKTTILTTSLGLGAVGVFGAFAAHSDILAIAPAWVAMFASISEDAGVHVDRDKLLKIATGVLLGVGGLLGGMKMANTYFAYTGIGTIPAVVANAGMNAVATWLAGRAWGHIVLEEDLEQSVENLVRAMMASIGVALPGRG